MHKLIIEDDEGRTTVVPLIRDELTIGRKEGNTIRLTERNVSRRHARLFKKDGGIWVEDFSSYTGVRVNGVRLTAPTLLRETDQVAIGDYKLSVRSEAAAEALPATAPILHAAVQPPVPAAPPAQPASPAHSAQPAEPLPAAFDGRIPAPVPLEAAPTMPLLTLEQQGRLPPGVLPGGALGQSAPPTTQPARLVVVTTELAGMEFRLDRGSLVIGRTEENDIILNHASISRHHAKVVRDGDRYTIVDLQSANGVRVAGESYERVDVQPGDVVELGHVKLRFVGPFEEWAFDSREFAPASRHGLKFAAAGLGVALAALLVFALQGKPDNKEKPAPVVVAPAPPPVPAGPSSEALFAEATAAAGTENWDKAVTALDLLLSRPPEATATTADASSAEAAGPADAGTMLSQAADLKRKVDFERRSADIFASFEKAVAAKEPDVALTRYEDIPAESIYKPRAEPSLAEMKALFLAAHLDLADSARQQGRCDEAQAESEKVQQIDPENRKAREIVRKCKVAPPARVATAVPARSVAAPRSVPTATAAVPSLPQAAKTVPARSVRPLAGTGSRGSIPTNTTTEPPALGAASSSAADDAKEKEDPAELIKQAREAWMRQQCGAAIDLSRRALKSKPGSNDAHQIIAVCACSSKDKEGAIRSYSRLDERSRAMVRTLCARNGVELIE